MTHPAAATTARIAVLTALAMVAFAANSVLCRMALAPGAIDPASFTTIRLVSGAGTLALIIAARTGGVGRRGSWASASFLFLYAAAFSFAYVSLSAGTGALILFGTVQATMVAWALRSGERPHPMQWLGLATALAGLAWLVSPGVAAPAPLGALLMATAGIAWGVYSLLGRGTRDPLADTAGNFLRAAPMALVLSLLWMHSARAGPVGVALAVASGALASGVGYVIWYAALRGLTATRAATVQLSVPVIAAAGGVLFLGERVDLRLVSASVLILGGIGLALAGRERAVG